MPDSDATIIAEFAEGNASGNASGGFNWWIVAVIVAALLLAAGVVLFILERQNKIDLFGRNKKKNKKKANRGKRPRSNGSEGETGEFAEGDTAQFGSDTGENETQQPGDTQDFFFYRFDD